MREQKPFPAGVRVHRRPLAGGVPPDPGQVRKERTATLAVVTCTSFVAPFMVSATNVALPAIQAEFHIDAVLLSWIATSYLLAKVILLLPISQVADAFGRKKIFLLGLSVFIVASLGAALARNAAELILLRVLQGLAIAMVITTGVAILISVFPASSRGRAIGIYVTGVYLGLSAGPTIGGVMTQAFGWRSIFIAVVPLGLGSLYLTMRYLKGEWKPSAGRKLDWTGSALYILSMLAITYAVSLLPHPRAYAVTALGLIGLCAFARFEKRASNPVFELSLFRDNRLFTFSSLAALISYAATYAITFMLSLYLQLVKGLSPQSAGLILVAQPLMQAMVSPLSGMLSDRIEPALIATLGMLLTALGLLFLVFLGAATPSWQVVAILVLLGVGFGLFSSPNMNAIMGSVEKEQLSVASGVVATMRLIGQMVSMVVVTIVFTLLLGQTPITGRNQIPFLQSFKTVFVIATLFCSAAIFLSMARGRRRKG